MFSCNTAIIDLRTDTENSEEKSVPGIKGHRGKKGYTEVTVQACDFI